MSGDVEMRTPLSRSVACSRNPLTSTNDFVADECPQPKGRSPHTKDFEVFRVKEGRARPLTCVLVFGPAENRVAVRAVKSRRRSGRGHDDGSW